MKISTRGRYAVKLMIDIAIHGRDGNVSLKDVSERQNISLKYLEQIASLLSHSGFLRSQRGAQGGYRIAKPPKECTIGEILRVTEGNLAPVSCLESEVNSCPMKSTCPTLGLWQGLFETVTKYLDSVTVADLLAKSEAASGEFCYCI